MPSPLEMPLADWTGAHIQQIIADQIEEGQRLEYKRELDLSGGSDRQRKEAAKDASGMANAQGGLIIYGIDEQEHVFPGPTLSGYLTPKMVANQLYAAMAAAGVSREGASVAKRSFHSFRHSHAAMALGAGASISWLQRRLGHQSITITVDRYGHFEAATRKAEAAKLEDVFRL
jgi:integrase